MPARSALFVGDFPANALLFQDIVLRLELEGMEKRRARPYTFGPERSGDWLKINRKGAVPAERFKRWVDDSDEETSVTGRRVREAL